jgi:outer membrane lipoprotein-sorting protein
LSVRARWAVPAGVVAITGVVIAAATVANAYSAPSLPSRTAAQLLTEVAQGTAKPLGPLTATVQQTSDLGLPALPDSGQQGRGPSLSSSPDTTSVWYRDPQHFRVAEQVQAGETDLRVDGRTLWEWDSKTQTATKYVLPAHSSQAGSGARSSPAPQMPAAAATQLLKAVGPTTIVGVQRNVYVAGRAAYQLSLVPRSSKSLVGSVLIAIDASRHIPLRVEVLPRGSSTVAYSIGFTALSFGTPAASNFSFTPPPGATVKNVTVPGNLKSVLGPAGLAGLPLGSLAVPGGLAKPLLHVVKGANGKFVIAGGSTAVTKSKLPKIVSAVPLRARKQIEAQFAKSLPASMTKAQRAAAIKAFDQHLLGRHLLGNGGGFVKAGTGSLAIAGAHANAPHVIGTSWLSVIATPPNPQVAAAVQQLLRAGLGTRQPRTTVTYGSSTASSTSTATAEFVSPPVGPDLAILQALLKATVPVHGSWGTGRLLRTTLLTVLVTSKGQILAGAVAPSVLYADVAADAG